MVGIYKWWSVVLIAQFPASVSSSSTDIDEESLVVTSLFYMCNGAFVAILYVVSPSFFLHNMSIAGKNLRIISRN